MLRATTVTVTITSDKAHTGYRHEALLYEGEQGFVDAVVPFIADGVARRQPVMVAVLAPRIAALRSALGDDVEGVSFVDMAELGANPARIIPAWQDFVKDAGPGTPAARGVGEPIWPGRGADEIVECQLHESLLNLAVGPDVPLWLVCPYDVQSLDAELVVEAHHSHPAVNEHNDYRGSVIYGGAYHAASMFGQPLAEPPGHADRLVLASLNDSGLLEWVQTTATNAGLAAQRSEQLAAVTHRLALAGLRATHELVQVCWWVERSGVVLEVKDRAVLHDPMIGRRPGELETARGRAVRTANDVCDLVQVRSGGNGTTVRMHCKR